MSYWKQKTGNSLKPGKYNHYVSLNGTSDYISTFDSVANSTNGDLEVIIKLSFDNVTGAYIDSFMYKGSSSGGFDFLFRRESSSKILKAWIHDGTAWRNAQTNDFFSAGNGESTWLRVTIDMDNGSSDSDFVFYYSTETMYPTNWTQIGSVRNAGQTITRNNSSADILLGAEITTTTPFNLFRGKIYYAEVRDGINGPIVARFNASEINPNKTTFPNILGEQEWTKNGGTYGA